MNFEFLAGLWPMVLKFGVAGVLVAGLVAFAFFSPVLKKTAAWLASLIVLTTLAYTVGVSDGENRVNKRWDAAIAAEAVQGAKDRTRAERDVAAQPDGVRNDKRNRDNGKK